MSGLPEGLRFRPSVRLGDLDGPGGNVYAVMGAVRTALAESGQREASTQFWARAAEQRSYQAVLDLVREYVDVVDQDD